MKWDDTSSKWTFQLPPSLPSGQYLLRFEHIALHSASNTNGAQFYISCAQLNVQGGNGNPGPLVSLPGAYSPTQPNIKINIYYPVVRNIAPPLSFRDCRLTLGCALADLLYRPRPSYLGRLDLRWGIYMRGSAVIYAVYH